jgi:hypothetical protein
MAGASVAWGASVAGLAQAARTILAIMSTEKSTANRLDIFFLLDMKWRFLN